jgi:hypothetical protein
MEEFYAHYSFIFKAVSETMRLQLPVQQGISFGITPSSYIGDIAGDNSLHFHPYH